MCRRSIFKVIAGAALVLTLDSSAISSLPSGYVGQYTWNSRDPRMGGMSGLEMDDAGIGFVAISDRGGWTQGRLIRNSDGVIVGIEAAKVQLLKSKNQRPLTPSRADSEGLAIAPDGTAYISFEGVARVLRYRQLGGVAENLPVPAAFAKMPHNSSLEALAIGPDGALYTLPERSGRATKPFPIYRFRNGEWDQPFNVPRTGTYLPVAADFGPDGRLYILERQFNGVMGFSSRVRRFELGKTSLRNEQTLLTSHTGQFDNLEGMSVWRDSKGALRVTMISDDNFMIFQRTQFVEYRVPD